MRGDTSIVSAGERKRDMVAGLRGMLKEALGDATEEVVVQAASGGGATNESNVEINIEKIELHVHEDAEADRGGD